MASSHEFALGLVGTWDWRSIDFAREFVFARVFARARVLADSGGMYTVLISRSGRVYITGHNNKYQLCLGDAYTDTAFMDHFHEVQPW